MGWNYLSQETDKSISRDECNRLARQKHPSRKPVLAVYTNNTPSPAIPYG
ncbi:hypothetical protein [Bacteroides clarus]|nr:hypothetical protein [Bacteroides clarus]